MKVRHHTVISLAVAGTLFAAFRSMPLSVAAFAAGIFVDIDHGFDYLREYGPRLDLKFFFRLFSFNHGTYRIKCSRWRLRGAGVRPPFQKVPPFPHTALRPFRPEAV